MAEVKQQNICIKYSFKCHGNFQGVNSSSAGEQTMHRMQAFVWLYKNKAMWHLLKVLNVWNIHWWEHLKMWIAWNHLSSKAEELLSVTFLTHCVFHWGSSELSEWQTEYTSDFCQICTLLAQGGADELWHVPGSSREVSMSFHTS